MKLFQNEDLTPEVLATLSQDELDWCYNALDCTVTLEIHHKQLASIDDIAARTYQFSLDLTGPVLEVNMRGILVDELKRHEVLSDFRRSRSKLERNFLRLVVEGVGMPSSFNYRSPAQLKVLLYDVLGIHPHKARNAEGDWVPTVNRDALEKAAEYFSARLLCKHLLLLRDLDKKIQFLEQEIDNDHRARTSINIGGTNTGRVSSSHSDEGTGGNQQNIDRKLRTVYVPDPGKKFCNIDLEQGDSRNVGAICWELFVDTHGEAYAGSYLNACESGDLHTAVARMTWPGLAWTGDIKPDRKIADEIFYRDFSRRDMTKRLGHGTNYYGLARTMATKTKIEVAAVEAFQRSYFGAFPVLGNYDHKLRGDNWHTWVRDQIDQAGYLLTPFYGRRRYFFGRPEDDATIREAIAYSPQSMTADAINTAWINLWRWGKVDILIQVHDSLLIQFPAEQEDEIVPEILRLAKVIHRMKKGRDFFVPVEAKIGWNWGDVEYNKDGTVKANPDGLIKWKPDKKDTRPRPKRMQSVQGILDARS